MTSQNPSSQTASLPASPLLMGAICYAVWGLAPLVYLPIHAFGGGAIEIICHRAIWALTLLAVLILITRQGANLKAIFRHPAHMGLLLLSATMLTANWGVFVWAVTHGRTLETSLGYYLNPLLNMAAGAIFFRERLDRYGQAAIALAVAGVALQALAIGHIPLVSLFLAFSFAGYGLVRKQLAVTAMSGLFTECLFMCVPAIIYLGWLAAHGGGHFLSAPSHIFWFMLTGPVTVIPLALFSYAARRLPLSTLGFLQFIAPTITFCIGLNEGEPFSLWRGVSFVVIWIGAGVFAYGAWRRLKAVKLAAG
ncbi:EamA family transporter RarD [Asticcacaulis sp. EMRT-3]|uniref:EamA family transporter RarD n=1 Tax=Asticcacaulis sp. EMRT-3 TaxID=3040349 RepID=UPI0024B000DB|nr:EamA family transporter RarD [Asticcacaulis sp. EMRT-3]MDI7776064.1 EamA family transporter RarD [Asticcacaulis sp. EMRT-3]